MSLPSDDLQARIRHAEFMWQQIAHERVKERLDTIFAVAAFRSGFQPREDDLSAAYSAQVSRFRNITSRIVARELEEAVFRLEDDRVQSAFEIYCDETPQRKVIDRRFYGSFTILG